MDLDNDDGRVKNLFWADARSRAAYDGRVKNLFWADGSKSTTNVAQTIELLDNTQGGSSNVNTFQSISIQPSLSITQEFGSTSHIERNLFNSYSAYIGSDHTQLQCL
ncbi:hypothetical protein OROHE_010145 [Orobanche hederae]